MFMLRRTRGGLALTLAIGLTLLALIAGIGILAYNGRSVFADGNPHPTAPTATPIPPTFTPTVAPSPSVSPAVNALPTATPIPTTTATPAPTATTTGGLGGFAQLVQQNCVLGIILLVILLLLILLLLFAANRNRRQNQAVVVGPQGQNPNQQGGGQNPNQQNPN
jgi:hypothetical protein